MAPGGEMLRYHQHFGENVLRHGSHEWLPYSKNEVSLKSSNTNLPLSIPAPNPNLASRGPYSSREKHSGHSGGGRENYV